MCHWVTLLIGLRTVSLLLYSQGPLPIKWMAVESLTHKVFNTRTDVWSYGVTVWELFSLAATPYPGVELDETFIDRLLAGYRMDKPKHAPQDV